MSACLFGEVSDLLRHQGVEFVIVSPLCTLAVSIEHQQHVYHLHVHQLHPQLTLCGDSHVVHCGSLVARSVVADLKIRL